MVPWNVPCMKIYEIKFSLFFSSPSNNYIVWPPTRRHYVCLFFFQITMMMTMTKQKFFKGSKVSFFSTEAKFDVFKKWVNYTQITKNSNLSFHFRIVLFFYPGSFVFLTNKKVAILILIFQKQALQKVFWCFISNKVIVLMTYIDFFPKRWPNWKGGFLTALGFIFFAFIHILTLKIVSTGCVNFFSG